MSVALFLQAWCDTLLATALLVALILLVRKPFARHFGPRLAYALWLVPALRFSNGKKKGTGNRKCGNRYLAWGWMEAANFAIRFEPAIHRWYQRNATRKPRLVALKAVAHKLARTGYYLLRDGGTFDVHRAFA